MAGGSHVKNPGLILALFLLAGCSSEHTSDYSQYARLVGQTLHGQTTDTLRAQAIAIPYASLAVRVGDQSPFILVLATDTGGDRIWTSASRITLLTRNGRIARSLGLPRNRSAQSTDGQSEIPAPAEAFRRGPYEMTRREDFIDLGVYGATVTCRGVVRGRTTIKIIGQAVPTVRVDENCDSRELNWSFVDSFWLDPDSGLAWRTQQHIHPKGNVVETNILRPPG